MPTRVREHSAGVGEAPGGLTVNNFTQLSGAVKTQAEELGLRIVVVHDLPDHMTKFGWGFSPVEKLGFVNSKAGNVDDLARALLAKHCELEGIPMNGSPN